MADLHNMTVAELAIGLKKKDFLLEVEQKAAAADQRTANNEPLVGKEFFRNPEVNLGFYSKKRTGVADVDPKVSLNQRLKYAGDGAVQPDPRQAAKKSRN